MGQEEERRIRRTKREGILASERNNASRKRGKDNKGKEDFSLVPSQKSTEHLPKPELYNYKHLKRI